MLASWLVRSARHLGLLPVAATPHNSRHSRCRGLCWSLTITPWLITPQIITNPKLLEDSLRQFPSLGRFSNTFISVTLLHKALLLLKDLSILYHYGGYIAVHYSMVSTIHYSMSIFSCVIQLLPSAEQLRITLRYNKFNWRRPYKQILMTTIKNLKSRAHFVPQV